MGLFSRFKSAFQKSPRREFQDPELGIFILESAIWSGKAKHADREIQFYVAGTEDIPYPVLKNSLRKLLANFKSTEMEAENFLKNQESELKDSKLSFYSVDFLWEDRPDDFSMEFLADENDSVVWRVNFQNGKPKNAGFDD